MRRPVTMVVLRYHAVSALLTSATVTSRTMFRMTAAPSDAGIYTSMMRFIRSAGRSDSMRTAADTANDAAKQSQKCGRFLRMRRLTCCVCVMNPSPLHSRISRRT